MSLSNDGSRGFPEARDAIIVLAVSSAYNNVDLRSCIVITMKS